MSTSTDTVVILGGLYALYSLVKGASDLAGRGATAVIEAGKSAGRAIVATPKQIAADVSWVADFQARRLTNDRSQGPLGDGSEGDEREAVARMLASETSDRLAWPWMVASVIRWARQSHKTMESLLAIDGEWGPRERSNGREGYASTRQKATPQTYAIYDSASENWDRFLAAHPSVISFVEGKGTFDSFVARNPELSLVVKVNDWYFLGRK